MLTRLSKPHLRSRLGGSGPWPRQIAALPFLRVLPLLALALLVCTQAGGSELACPSRITFSGLASAPGSSAQGMARLDGQARLLCLYQGINLQALAPRPAGGTCRPVPLQPMAGGGSGTWRFGPPVGSASVTPPVQQSGNGCLHGGGGFAITGLIAWREPPAGEVCTLHPDAPSRFLCGASGDTATPVAACPVQLQATSIPTAAWTAETPTGFLAPESLLLHAETGRLAQTNLSFRQLREAMGPAFPRAIFLLASPPFASSTLPPGSYACLYTGPRFARGRQVLAANIAIACTGPCALR